MVRIRGKSFLFLAAPLLCAVACGDDDSSSMMTGDSAVMEDSAVTPDGALPDGALPDGALPDGQVGDDAALADGSVETPDAAMDAEVYECIDPGTTGPDCDQCIEGYEVLHGVCRKLCGDENSPLTPKDCGVGGTCAAHQDDDEVSKCWCDEGYEGNDCELCERGYVKGENDTCELNLPSETDLVLWLDGDATDSITLDDQGQVSKWHDRRPATNQEVAPPFGTARPIYRPNFRNGYGALDFDGVDDYLNANGFGGLSTGAFEVIWAGDPRTGSTGVLGGVTGTNNWGIQVNRVDGTKNFEVIVRDPAADSGGDTLLLERESPARPMYLIANRHITGVNDSFACFASDGDGDEVPNLHLYDEAQSSLNNPMNLRIGQTQAGYLKGMVYEVLVYSKRLSVAEREAVTDYLRGKWNLQ